MAGYSGTPLAKKLGVRAGHVLALLSAPPPVAASLALPGIAVVRSLRGTRAFDVALLFVSTCAELETRFADVAARLTVSGGLWVCWPKKASGVLSDISDAEVRRFGLAAGLVDNKVCAVDETWSGLRFVRRVKDR